MNDFMPIPGLLGCWTRSLKQHLDCRGRFTEQFRISDLPISLPDFVQDSYSFSEFTVLRGMHLQVAQWQLVTVLEGSIVDVLLDCSPQSVTFENAKSLIMNEDGQNQILMRPGVAHGFAVTSKGALVHYKSTKYYGETHQYGVSWNTPQLENLWPNIEWTISDRDKEFPMLDDLVKNPDFLKAQV